MCENVVEPNKLIKQMSARQCARHGRKSPINNKSIISANEHMLSADKTVALKDWLSYRIQVVVNVLRLKLDSLIVVV